MRLDFTIDTYKRLLLALKDAGYSFQTFRDYLKNPKEKVIILRHDVDARKLHSLLFAQIQHELGIKGTYYFRVVKESYDEVLMREIETMGHEVGLHYEEMDLTKGDEEKAFALFQVHLQKFRGICKIDTICMHGSPRSKYDNKDIWKKNDYRSLEIIGEPYFDLDTANVYYLTDTGMMWDGHRFSIRDKMNGNFGDKRYHCTDEIITDVALGVFPSKCMMNFHPQRWHFNVLNWGVEKMQQSLKNIVKSIVLKYRS